MTTRSLILITFAIITVPASRAASPFAQTPHAGFIITNVRVFDEDGVHERTQVAVEGGIIRAVGPDLATWRHLPATVNITAARDIVRVWRSGVELTRTVLAR